MQTLRELLKLRVPVCKNTEHGPTTRLKYWIPTLYRSGGWTVSLVKGPSSQPRTNSKALSPAPIHRTVIYSH